jgi:hypothetical protein
MLVGFLQILAVKRAGKGNFALRPATQRADVPVNSGTCSARAALPADLAKNLSGHRLTAIIGSGEMQRVDLYIKVELELDEDEKLERVAGEICRHLEKLYPVRRAEVSNAVARD